MLRKIITTLGGLGVAGAIAAALSFGAPATASAAFPTAAAVSAERPRGENADAPARGARHLVRSLVRATAELTEKTPAEVRDAVVAGQSLAQFASANGSSGEAVVQAVAARARERLDRAVANGRMTQAEADAALQELTTRATEIVNDATLGQKIAERQGR